MKKEKKPAFLESLICPFQAEAVQETSLASPCRQTGMEWAYSAACPFRRPADSAAHQKNQLEINNDNAGSPRRPRSPHCPHMPIPKPLGCLEALRPPIDVPASGPLPGQTPALGRHFAETPKSGTDHVPSASRGARGGTQATGRALLPSRLPRAPLQKDAGFVPAHQ